MVAITVILAAVIAAFVLDIGDTGEPVQANIDVSTSAADEDGNVSVTLTVTDASNVDSFELRSDEPCDGGDDDLEDAVGDLDDDGISVGNSGTADECEQDNDIIIVGESDGSEQIIVDTTI